MQLTLAVLNRILEEFIPYQDYREIKDTAVLDLIAALDHEERFWHVEDKLVWRIKSWRECLVNQTKKRELALKERDIVNTRKDVLAQLVDSIMKLFSIDSRKLAFPIALKILHKKDIKKAALLDVDISAVQELPVTYTILDKEFGDYNL